MGLRKPVRAWHCWTGVALLAGAASLTAWYTVERGPWASSRDASVARSVDADNEEQRPAPGLPWFEEEAAGRGITFQHFDSATPEQFIQETIGSGIGWIDYNNDGWPDLFCVQDGPVRPAASRGNLPTNTLYRNNGDGTFTDVTVQVGLARAGYGMGCAVGDYDNDGYDDLVVTCLGGLVLYHNEPDGKGGRRFVDVTTRSGLRDPHWATSCAWGDIDGDGYLDLYVCNYCDIDLKHYPHCEGKAGYLAVCPPSAFPPTPHRLFRNNGNGTFTDISGPAGLESIPAAPGLGVVIADLDGDGRPDLFVANDMKAGYLLHNRGDSRFEEISLLSGVAFGPRGSLVAGMGVDAADVDGTGRPSLFVTNFQNKPNLLYLNRGLHQGNLLFQEWSNPSGLGPPSIERLGFGTVLLDSTLAGHLDVAVANGHVDRNIAHFQGAQFAQRAQFFQGEGSGRFRDVSDQAGPYFRHELVGRGLAYADFDNDGLPDLAVSHNGGPIALLHNRTETPNRWVRLELVGDGRRSNRNAVGARVEIDSGGRHQVRFVNGGGSYLSASERRLLVGLGKAERAEQVMVAWPSGRRQLFRNLSSQHWWRLTEGKEKPEDVHPGRHAP